MKKFILVSFLLAVMANSAAQTPYYKPLGNDKKAYFNQNFNSNKSNYVGRPVSELLKDLEVPVGSFIVIPNYNNPEYGNEFRFSSADLHTTSTLIRNNNGELYMIYVKFSPQIKYPTSGFIRENRGKALSPEQYKEFEKYKIEDIYASVFPR